MIEPTIFVGTPIHTSQVHVAWVAGALGMHAAFPGRNRIEVQTGSFLPRSRDTLTSKFLQSGCTHMMCVDSDIGWRAEQVQQLLDTGKDFVSGVYCMKTAERELPFSFNDEQEGELRGCEWAPGGFLLVSRAAVEAMAEFAAEYDSGAFGRQRGFWFPLFAKDIPYSAEDVSFCRRWRATGGKIWTHMGVTLKHYGEACFEPG